MEKMKKISILLIVLVFISCKSGSDTEIDTENWDVFYKAFHSDSLFQLSRIADEFEGESFEEEETIKLTKANWRMLKTTIYEIDTTEYKVEIEKNGPVVKTRIFEDGSGTDIQSEFKLINGKWYLVKHIDNFN